MANHRPSRTARKRLALDSGCSGGAEGVAAVTLSQEDFTAGLYVAGGLGVSRSAGYHQRGAGRESNDTKSQSHQNTNGSRPRPIACRRSPEDIERRLRDPRTHKPDARMPKLNLSEAEVQALATYLSELR